MKPIKSIKKVDGLLITGAPAIMILPDGRLARTSPVVGYQYDEFGIARVETENTIYVTQEVRKCMSRAAEYTIWYGIRLKNKSGMAEITEHLAMNGYTFDTNGDDILFVFNEEIEYVETILYDHKIQYEAV